MSDTRASIGRNASYNLVAALIPMALALVTVPAYLKLVGPDRYGVLAIAWLLLGYFGLFDLGLGRATSHRIAALRDAPAAERATTLWTALAVNFATGLVGGTLLWLAADWFFANIFKVDPAIRAEVVAGVPYLALTVPIAVLTGVLSGALQGREKFLQTNSVSVSSTVLFQLFPLGVALLFGPDLPRLLLAALAARLVPIAMLWRLCRAEFTRGHPVRFDKKRVRELLSFGGWVSATSMIGPLLVVTDRFAIGAVLGATAVTLYSVPFQLAQRIVILPGALTGALFPRLSAASPEEQSRLGALAFRTLAAGMVLPVLIAIFAAEPFLRLWVGNQIGGQAAPIARLLLVGFWLNAFALIPFIRLQASGRPDKVAITLAAQVPFYLAGLWLAMSWFGLIGGAAMFVIRCFADYMLLSFVLERRVGGLGPVLINLTLLGVAAWAATAPPFGAVWTIALLGLGVIALLLARRNMPEDGRQRVLALLPARLRPKQRS